MAESNVFYTPYSDLDYSDPESDDSDLDPADLSLPDAEPIDSTDHPDATSAGETKQLETPLSKNVKNVLTVIAGLGLTVASFLDGLSWGDAACTADSQIRDARTRLLNSAQLPGIVRRWHKPPRATKSKAARPKGATTVMEGFATECLQKILDRELELLADIFKSPAGEDIKEEHLTGFSFPETVKRVKLIAPTLWSVLFCLARTPGQQERNAKKGICKCLYASLIFCLRCFDTLHAIGLTMSNKWTGNAVDRISKESMAAMRELMDRFPWLMTYDNALIAFRVFSQRVDKKTLHGSGTAGTVYIKRSAKPLPP
ncbi:hypothetical protein DFH06DRAFT_1045420, partial [Mycena polygramma]